MVHSNWRDLEEWRTYGLPMSTASNEAVKLYDAALTQFAGLKDYPALGGISGCVQKMLEADPNFVLGHVFKTGLEMMALDRSVANNIRLGRDIYNIAGLSEQLPSESWERRHACALKQFAEGNVLRSINTWEDIVTDYPLDMLSIQFLQTACILRGQQPRIKDYIARVLPYWKKHMPHYGFLLSIRAYGLEEANLYTEAERSARLALDYYRQDATATHAIAHVKEMTGKMDEGIQFLQETESDWSPSCFSRHHYWHWGLYHMEKGDSEAALGIYDNEVIQRLNTSKTLHSDVASYLFRLEMNGINVGNRWKDAYALARDHIDDNVYGLSDVNVYMACARAGEKKTTQRMMDVMKDFVNNGRGDHRWIVEEVTLPMCEAFQAYNDEDFDKVVDIMNPIRFKVFNIGGSHAQREVFRLFLIQSALKSKDPKNHKLARSLCMERTALKQKSPLVERLLAQIEIAHEN